MQARAGAPFRWTEVLVPRSGGAGSGDGGLDEHEVVARAVSHESSLPSPVTPSVGAPRQRRRILSEGRANYSPPSPAGRAGLRAGGASPRRSWPSRSSPRSPSGSWGPWWTSSATDSTDRHEGRASQLVAVAVPDPHGDPDGRCSCGDHDEPDQHRVVAKRLSPPHGRPQQTDRENREERDADPKPRVGQRRDPPPLLVPDRSSHSHILPPTRQLRTTSQGRLPLPRRRSSPRRWCPRGCSSVGGRWTDLPQHRVALKAVMPRWSHPIDGDGYDTPARPLRPTRRPMGQREAHDLGRSSRGHPRRRAADHDQHDPDSDAQEIRHPHHWHTLRALPAARGLPRQSCRRRPRASWRPEVDQGETGPAIG